ncbi:MAG: acetylglutamate kinase [Alphaproteobacteria bacterium]|nr:acetylglutamate kinase [Alphaproteobacteria bacterium]
MKPDRGPGLVEAAPYIEAFRDRLVVVKIGGELLDGGPVVERILPQVAVLYRCGLRPLIVHGGGRQVDDACKARGIEPVKHRGRRVTTPEVRDVLVDVIAKGLNQAIVDRLRADDIPAIGFADGVTDAVRARRRAPTDEDGVTVDWGEVGDVVGIQSGPLAQHAGVWAVPVLPSLGTAEDDGALLNVNADAVASRVATDLDAAKLVLLTSIAGVMEGADAAGPISQLTDTAARSLVASGVIAGGMRAKIEEALRALGRGVPRVHIISGREPATLLREIFTDEGCGTLVVPDEAGAR